ncbi:MAG: ThuA domain-containing protein [Rikenellaceae bacterium]
MNKLIRFFLFPVICIILGSCNKTINVALVTGHTDRFHSCEVMSPYLEKTLTENPNFEITLIDVTLTENEEIKFDSYDVIVLNINEIEWSNVQKQNFESYMVNGGGLVVVHEADNAFPEWAAYNEMIGLGGWGGRSTIEYGPFFYYLDGDYVTDSLSLGDGGKHGNRVAFEINVRDSIHPIMKGLPTSWTHYDDELYGNLRGPAKNIHPLATGFSDSKTGGTGKEELVLFTVNYGKGRVFHTVLGHSGKGHEKALKNRGFEVTLLRGTEWAATGDVLFECKF